MKQENEKPVGLPENAFRPLNEGEEYKPRLTCKVWGARQKV